MRIAFRSLFFQPAGTNGRANHWIPSSVRMMKIRMNALRALFSLAIVTSTCLLIGVLAFDRVSGVNNASLVELSLQIMHGSFLIGSVVFALYQIRHKQWVHLILTLAPIFSFLLAGIGVIVGVKPPVVTLLLFDFYLILYYFYLFLSELHCFGQES
ncbi:MAG: hypothetical protein HGB06_02130 [Chlorobaculum sp.]|nr:hypothetical protein [Chlorobaculum sp.]